MAECSESCHGYDPKYLDKVLDRVRALVITREGADCRRQL